MLGWVRKLIQFMTVITGALFVSGIIFHWVDQSIKIRDSAAPLFLAGIPAVFTFSLCIVVGFLYFNRLETQQSESRTTLMTFIFAIIVGGAYIRLIGNFAKQNMIQEKIRLAEREETRKLAKSRRAMYPDMEYGSPGTFPSYVDTKIEGGTVTVKNLFRETIYVYLWADDRGRSGCTLRTVPRPKTDNDRFDYSQGHIKPGMEKKFYFSSCPNADPTLPVWTRIDCGDVILFITKKNSHESSWAFGSSAND